MIYEVVPGKITHVRPMARKLRQAASINIGAYGYDPRRVLHDAFVTSHYCRTALIDGEPEAMWGLKGPLVSEAAVVWLVLSERATSMPQLIVSEAKFHLAQMGAEYSELATTVLPDDEASIRFAAFLGFHDHHNEEQVKMTHKQRAAQLRHNPRHRIPMGDSYVIALGWHGGR